MAKVNQADRPLLASLAELANIPASAQLRLLQQAQGDELRMMREMVAVGLVPELDAHRCFAEAMGLEFEAVDVADLDSGVLQLVPVEVMRRYQAVPLRWDGATVVVAMANPLDLFAVDGLQESLGAPVASVLCTVRFLDAALHHRQQVERGIEGMLARLDTRSLDESAFANPERLREIAGDDAIVQLADLLIDQALRRRASDIHVEAATDCLRVRYRIDGDLLTVHRFPRTLHSALVTRLKILAGVDIAERRKPQDGRFQRTSAQGGKIELRVSSLPAVHGEKLVMRILDKSRVSLDLAAQGMMATSIELLLRGAESANGIVLVTGPTGSGKTTTLYGVLQHLNTEDRNVVTVEDPVEYEIPGITQVQVDGKAERTFASVLRSILRQDPDVIMVGEIRDRETAEIAVHAALTGHMVLSTLHSNSAIGTLTRLIDIGIEPYLLAPTLRAVVGQRLVRRLCENCARLCDPPLSLAGSLVDGDVLESLPRAFRQPVGCRVCRQTGYAGRMPIHEVLAWTPALGSVLSRRGLEVEVAEAARLSGFEGLAVDGLRKAGVGLTTVEEVIAAVRT